MAGGKRVVLDRGLLPDVFQQVRLGDDMAAVLDKDEENLEGPLT